MPADDLPIEPDRLPDAPHEKTPIAARERRETERLITDWERETRQLGHALALMTLDVSAMTGPKWAHRFIIAVDPVVEDSSFLFYGARFASLLGLPETPNHSIPIVAQLPTQYIPMFTRGCITSTLSSSAVRMQGAVERENGGGHNTSGGIPIGTSSRIENHGVQLSAITGVGRCAETVNTPSTKRAAADSVEPGSGNFSADGVVDVLWRNDSEATQVKPVTSSLKPSVPVGFDFMQPLRPFHSEVSCWRRPALSITYPARG